MTQTIKKTAQLLDETDNDKIAGRYDPEEFDAMVQRLKTLAGIKQFKTVWDPVKKVYKNVPDSDSDETKHLDELTFLGSPCTKDCSGHRAGYNWSKQHGGISAASWSNSFNNGAELARMGR